jgi:hypothetical protein
MKNTPAKARAAISERSEAAAEAVETPVAVWIENTLESIEDYAKREPWPFGLCMLGVGFVLGWKLKIW